MKHQVQRQSPMISSYCAYVPLRRERIAWGKRPSNSIFLFPCKLQIAPAEGPDISERMVIITGPPEAQFKVSAKATSALAGPGHRTACWVAMGLQQPLPQRPIQDSSFKERNLHFPSCSCSLVSDSACFVHCSRLLGALLPFSPMGKLAICWYPVQWHSLWDISGP